jgi:formamidopyrimidine-DNA glycosylase
VPELPEVETVRRGIHPLVVDHRIEKVVVRDPRLRWRVPKNFPAYAQGRRIRDVDRRGKYLIFVLDNADRFLIHLGMSGRLFVLRQSTPPRKHDHVDFELDHGLLLRFNDARRFGAVLPWPAAQATHVLTRDMGPEPFSDAFSGDYLFKLSRGRSAPVKNFVMDGRVVVGAGNIYAAEALFRAGIRPGRPAGRVSRAEYQKLVQKVREVLQEAIEKGGTTLRDFASALGESGYFQQELFVYGREGEACRVCRTGIRRSVIGQRSSFFCPRCQK